MVGVLVLKVLCIVIFGDLVFVFIFDDVMDVYDGVLLKFLCWVLGRFVYVLCDWWLEGVWCGVNGMVFCVFECLCNVDGLGCVKEVFL